MLNICQHHSRFLWLITVLALLCFPCGHLRETEIKKRGKQGIRGEDKDPDGQEDQPVGMGKTKMYAHSFIQKRSTKTDEPILQKKLLPERSTYGWSHVTDFKDDVILKITFSFCRTYSINVHMTS